MEVTDCMGLFYSFTGGTGEIYNYNLYVPKQKMDEYYWLKNAVIKTNKYHMDFIAFDYNYVKILIVAFRVIIKSYYLEKG